MALISVYTADDELMANSVRDLMLQNGISAMIRSFAVPGYGIATQGVFIGGWGEVMVNEEDVEQAEELLTGFFDTFCESEESEDANQPD